MTRWVAFGLAGLIAAAPAVAATKSLTCYLDGGRISQEVAARRGYAEVTLPGDMIPGSLRIRPLADAVVARVQTVPAKVDPKTAKALAALDERKEALGDRLKALDTREEIFTAAAKSQSAKAPRKSKTNPEPVAAIRQGTDFALARLEEVYRARRTTEKELKALEKTRSDLMKKANVGGSVARIWLQGRDGSVRVDYVASGSAWTPVYDFRLDGTTAATVTLRAVLPEREPGVAVSVVAAKLADAGVLNDLPLAADGDNAAVATFNLPVTAQSPASPVSPLSFSLTNATTRHLPPGESSCFWKGEYFGVSSFPGANPGEQRDLRCGGTPVPPAKPAETVR
jgi:hypothetical protein